MDAERGVVPAETAEAVRRAKEEGRRVVAVGTTSVRTLEASARAHGGQRRAGPVRDAPLPRPGGGVPRRRRPPDELPPPPLDAPDARQRVRGTRAGPRRLPRGGRVRLPLLLLRRRDAHRLSGRGRRLARRPAGRRRLDEPPRTGRARRTSAEETRRGSSRPRRRSSGAPPSGASRRSGRARPPSTGSRCSSRGRRCSTSRSRGASSGRGPP